MHVFTKIFQIAEMLCSDFVSSFGITKWIAFSLSHSKCLHISMQSVPS